MPNDYELYPFQKDSVAWLHSLRDNGYGFTCDPNCGLIGHEMGLGKTAIALAAVRPLIAAGKKILFLVPGSTIIQWQRNFNRWINDLEKDPWETQYPELMALGGSKDRIVPGTSYVMSHNLLARADVITTLVAANFDGIVIDEIHKFGAEGTKRIKHLWALLNLTPTHFHECRIGLSGTPTRNYAKEIANIAKFVGFHTNERKTFVHEEFARKYLTHDRKALWNPHQFHDDFNPYYLRYTVKEVQKNLPEIRRTKLYTEITDPFIAKAYNNQLDLLSNLMTRGSNIEAFGLLEYLIKLRHITGIAKAKEPSIIEPIKEYLSGENGVETQRKAIIGIHHRFVTDRLKTSIKEFPHFLIRGGMDGYQKEHVKDDFIKYKGGAICQLSLKAAGEGIDGLQFAASKAYVFERQWNGADELQFEKRIHRTGQDKPCHIEYTIATGTVDEFFDEMVDEKLTYTTAVEDINYETNPGFLKRLAERVVANRLPTTQVVTYDDDPVDSVYRQPSLRYPVSPELNIEEDVEA